MDFINSSEVDVAYYVLSKAGKSMYYKDLVMEVIEKKRKPVQSLSNAISEVYTLINMDSRFHYEGKSMWGLTGSEAHACSGFVKDFGCCSIEIEPPPGKTAGGYPGGLTENFCLTAARKKDTIEHMCKKTSVGRRQ